MNSMGQILHAIGQRLVAGEQEQRLDVSRLTERQLIAFDVFHCILEILEEGPKRPKTPEEIEIEEALDIEARCQRVKERIQKAKIDPQALEGKLRTREGQDRSALALADLIGEFLHHTIYRRDRTPEALEQELDQRTGELQGHTTWWKWEEVIAPYIALVVEECR